MDTGFKNLKAYKLAYQLALDIFNATKSFPKEEKYSLTDQIRRSSRSICAILAEAYRKRSYTQQFIKLLIDSDAECSETLVWLDFSRDFNYISQAQHTSFTSRCNDVGNLLGYMINNPKKFQQTGKAVGSNQPTPDSYREDSRQ